MKNSIHILSFLAAVPFIGHSEHGFAQNKSPKPNVILIYGDDVGYGDVSCNGAKTINTPNIDSLARHGVRFNNLHSAAATCTPSRFALLTGEYPWRQKGTAIAKGDAALIINPERFTLADVFKNAGYQTAVVGKWHLGLGEKDGRQNWNGHIAPGPAELGFGYSFIIPATGDRVPCVYIENGDVVNLDASDPVFVSYERNFEGEPTGKSNPELLTMHPSDGHDMAIVNGIPRIGFMKGGKSALWQDQEISTVLTGKAISFIEENKNRPFFLYFATHDIHVPRVPNHRFVGKSGMGPRGDAILEFDWSMGEVMKTIEKLGIEKNTIIIITSDNGPVVDDGYQDQAAELLGNHKPAGEYRGGKCSNFEGGTRVPGILSWKGTVKPGVSNKLLCQTDLFVSFAKFLKIKLPRGTAPDSENMLSTWLNKGGEGRNILVLQNPYHDLSVVTKMWKYIVPGNGIAYNPKTNTELGNSPQPQLYNLLSDIGEKVNVASQNPQIVKRLQSKLQKIKAQVNFSEGQ